MLLLANQWKDYECIDAGNGEKLERWKSIVLRRPDPQMVWPIAHEDAQWLNPHAHYHRSETGGGQWDVKKPLPESWTINYKQLTFKIQPTGFKHTGLFPEQAVNWDWMTNKIQNARGDVRILNLFAYTGGASVACAAAGASEVVHLDAAKGMVQWAKENIELSNLSHRTVRFIVEDVVKFVQREIRRGKTYHGIIMAHPSYGRGPSGEVWQIEDKLHELIELCQKVLDEHPLFFVVNSYTTGFSSTALHNVLSMTVQKRFPHGKITTGELGLPITQSGLVLPCGIVGRWESNQ